MSTIRKVSNERVGEDMSNMQFLHSMGLDLNISPEVFGGGITKIFETEINSQRFPNNNVLFVGALGSGRTYAAKLAILRQTKDTQIFIINGYRDYNDLVTSLGGNTLTDIPEKLPEARLILFDTSYKPHEGLEEYTTRALGGIREEAETRRGRKLLVVDELIQVMPEETSSAEPLIEMLTASHEMNMSVLLITEEIESTDISERWRRLLDATAVKALFKQPPENLIALESLGFAEGDSYTLINFNQGEGCFQYPNMSDRIIEFKVNATETESTVK